MVELIIDAKAILGEGPVWDSDQQHLYWVDILGKKIHIYDPEKKMNNTINVNQYVGAIALKEAGGLLLAMQHGFYSLDFETKQLTPIEDPEKGLPKNRFNDGKCDPAGRFWVGTMELDGLQGQGSLYCMDTDYFVKKVLSDLSISNGLAWSPDHQTMYFIDSPTSEVVAFDYDIHSGSISNRRVAVRIPSGEGVPDGMTIDCEGMLWIAHYGDGKVSRWNPENGKCVDVIPVPARNVTSCVFGGENLDELYITTARYGLDDETLEREPDAGGVFRLKTNVQGCPSYKFCS